MDVVVVTDAAYLPWCATAILSCATAAPPGGLHFHVLLASDVSDEDRERLGELAGSDAVVTCHRVDESLIATFPSKGPQQGDRLSWVRVVLAEALPDVDKVLYLDADTFVVDDPTPLWDTALATPVAAVTNVTERSMRTHVTSLVREPADYFNAGVFVADLGAWRAEDVAGEVRRFVHDHGPLPWFDQDALNSVFAGRWTRVHPRWNAMNSLWTWSDVASELLGLQAVAEATSKPAVLHFEGPSLCKPWHYLCDHPWREAYRATLRHTPWASTPVEDRTAATRLIRRLPLPQRAEAYNALYRLRGKQASIRDALAARVRGRRLRSGP